ncbi:MAG: GNAT family acetyltransferase [Allobranchiibius sp.]
MQVKTTTLRMTQRPENSPRALPDGARIDRIDTPTPEFIRWLYAAVGGPWRWTDRLSWTREQWAQDLARPGTEAHVLYVGGAPAGYVQLDAVPISASEPEVLPGSRSGGASAAMFSRTEVVYFGLMEHVIGRGLGGVLLHHGIEMAWSLGGRCDLPPTAEVWLHTCDLDGPHALANYQARGFEITGESSGQQDYPREPLGAWASTGGPI